MMFDPAFGGLSMEATSSFIAWMLKEFWFLAFCIEACCHGDMRWMKSIHKLPTASAVTH